MDPSQVRRVCPETGGEQLWALTLQHAARGAHCRGVCALHCAHGGLDCLRAGQERGQGAFAVGERCLAASSSGAVPALLQLRREIPEAVVSAQALLDEQLPLMRNVASGAGALLQQVQAAVAAHDAQLPAKQQQLNKVAETLIVQQDNVFVLAAEAQRERHEQEIRAAVLAARQDAMRHGQHS